MTRTAWEAWYDDGSVYSSSDLTWAELPKHGIVGVVVYREPPYRKIVSGGDWYYLDDEPTCTDTHDEWGGWLDPPDVPPSELKRSGTVSDDEWERIQQEMMESRHGDNVHAD